MFLSCLKCAVSNSFNMDMADNSPSQRVQPEDEDYFHHNI